jgi:tetratricopeptide (TPR) repeat protein
MQSAIKHKNINRAYVASSFARNVWGKNYIAGSKAEEYEMLYYYKSVKDTSRYFQRASSYYDNYYMKVSADSIKKMTSTRNELNLEQAKKKAEAASKIKLDSIAKAGGKIISVLRDTFTVRTRISTGNSYASTLNNIAYEFYSTGTKNLTHLSKALIWSKRSIELEPKSEYYDTLAHIYYAMKIYNEANATQKTAVEIARTTKQIQKAEQYIKELKKMEAKQL